MLLAVEGGRRPAEGRQRDRILREADPLGAGEFFRDPTASDVLRCRSGLAGKGLRAERRLHPRQSTDRMLNELLRLGCAPGILATGVFPNAKELSKSMGAFEAVRQGLIGAGRADVLRDPDVVFYDVGSGRAPRTAVLVAFRSRWKCVAIDPMLAPASDRLRFRFAKIDRAVHLFVGR